MFSYLYQQKLSLIPINTSHRALISSDTATSNSSPYMTTWQWDHLHCLCCHHQAALAPRYPSWPNVCWRCWLHCIIGSTHKEHYIYQTFVYSRIYTNQHFAHER